VAAYQIEGMELARRTGLDARRLALALSLAVILGFVIGGYTHLTTYYQYGAQHLRGGIWGTAIAVPEYEEAVRLRTSPAVPELPRIVASVVGAAVAAVLWLLRIRLAGFPLHPLGYAMTCCVGYNIWASFLVVWLLKSLALRYGGMRFYRKTIPFFLGFALGHFLVAGMLWGLMGVWAGEAVRGYTVRFG
jgi:hypothetical protein